MGRLDPKEVSALLSKNFKSVFTNAISDKKIENVLPFLKQRAYGAQKFMIEVSQRKPEMKFFAI